MTSLLTAQREIADNILDAQWEAKWRQDKVCSNPGLPLFKDIVLHLFWLPSIQDREVTSELELSRDKDSVDFDVNHNLMI